MTLPCALDAGGTACCGESPCRDAVRECPTCPPWVIRCAHWDGDVLWLASRALWSHTCSSSLSPDVEYALLARSETEPCAETGEPFVHPRKDVWYAHWPERLFNERAEADAAFHEAEARLLAGEL